MADTGKIATQGFGAGAIKYVVLDGFTTAAATTVNACLITFGFGAANTHKITLLGFVGATAPGSAGAFYIFGESVIR